MENIFSSVGIYPNGSYKVNGVSKVNITDHIEYNKTYRPGRALFIEGICHNKGSLTEAEVIEWSDRIMEDKETFWRDVDTQPYK